MTPHTPPVRIPMPRSTRRRTASVLAGVVVIAATPFVASALGDEPAAIESAITSTIVESTTTSPSATSASLDSSAGSPSLDAPADVESVPTVAPATDELPAAYDASTADRNTATDQDTPADPATASDPNTPAAPNSTADQDAPADQAAAPDESAQGELVDTEPERSDVEDVDVAPTTTEPEVDPLDVLAVLTDAYQWDERGPRVEALQTALGMEVDGVYGAQTAGVHRSALGYLDAPTDNVPAAPLPPGPSASAWAALRDCESGGDYSITNPSGTYRGAYQFNRSTWDSVASRHAPGLVGVDPAAAAPADQDAMAFALYSERGSQPWPHCGRYLN